ncbi:MAG: hypothetical protein EOP87_23745, partial [Verrucomicrobiaceae bacterium]
QIVSSPVAAAVTIALIYMFGIAGGAAAISVASLATLGVHLWFIREFRPRPTAASIDYRARIIENLKTGSGFAINGIYLTGTGWLTLYLLRHYYGDQGLHQIGMFGAASMLANFYVGIVISALATEFYPALTALADKRDEMRTMLNRQAVMAMDIGASGALFGLTFAPLALTLLYSSQFSDATEVLRLLFVATGIRFAAFPLGYTIMAAGKSKLFATCELAMGGVTLVTAVLGIHFFGLLGVGYAQIAANLIQVVFLLVVCSKIGITWNRHSAITATVASVFVAATLLLVLLYTGPYAWAPPLVIALGYSSLALNRVRRGLGISLASILARFGVRR